MLMPLLVPPWNRPVTCPEAGQRQVPAAAPGDGDAATLGALAVADLPAAAERVELRLRFESACFAGAFCVSTPGATSDFAVVEPAREACDVEEARDRCGYLGEVPHATTNVQISTPTPARRPETMLELWGISTN